MIGFGETFNFAAFRLNKIFAGVIQRAINRTAACNLCKVRLFLSAITILADFINKLHTFLLGFQVHVITMVVIKSAYL